MVKAIKIQYIKSVSITIFSRDIFRYERDGFRILRITGETAWAVKPSVIKLTFIVDSSDEIKVEDVHDLISKYYGLQRVGEKRADKFLQEIQEGKIQLKLNEKQRLEIA